MARSLAFGAAHVCIAFGVGFLLSRSVEIAGAITLVEPLANTVVHELVERWREGRRVPAQPWRPAAA